MQLEDSLGPPLVYLIELGINPSPTAQGSARPHHDLCQFQTRFLVLPATSVLLLLFGHMAPRH